MPSEKKESGEDPSKPRRTVDEAETVSLVDFLDDVDRAAFRRALELRDSYYPLIRTS